MNSGIQGKHRDGPPTQPAGTGSDALVREGKGGEIASSVPAEIRARAQTAYEQAYTRAYRAYLGASPAAGDPLGSPLAEGEGCAPGCSCGTMILSEEEVVFEPGTYPCEGCGENCQGIKEVHKIQCRSVAGVCGQWGTQRQIMCQPRWWKLIDCCGKPGCNCPPGDCHDPAGSGSSGPPVYGYNLMATCEVVNDCPRG
jgi:hypothetical protein